jgi:hypothetical protein
MPCLYNLLLQPDSKLYQRMAQSTSEQHHYTKAWIMCGVNGSKSLYVSGFWFLLEFPSPSFFRGFPFRANFNSCSSSSSSSWCQEDNDYECSEKRIYEDMYRTPSLWSYKLGCTWVSLYI